MTLITRICRLNKGSLFRLSFFIKGDKKLSKFFVFEGPDGSGKSTLMNKVADKLDKETDYNIITTKEPGAKISATNKNIRDSLLNHQPSTYAELMLFLADRAEHINKFVLPKLEEDNNIIISDRYWESSIVYQSFYRKLISYKELKKLHELITNKTYPDKTFVIHSSYSHSKSKKDNMELTTDRKVILMLYNKLNDLKLDYQLQYLNTDDTRWERYVEQIFKEITSVLPISTK